MADVKDLKNGQGAVMAIAGKKVAVYKDAKGKLIYLSPVCRHQGCAVGWNKKDKTWDCPCHGSRYEADGALKHGPATSGLLKIKI